jgi:hypothetical protein
MNPLAVDFDRLQIESVMLNGEPYTDFDENNRLLNIHPDQPGLFAVTYEMAGSQSTEEIADIPFDLLGIYPNPFHGNANLRFRLNQASDVEINVTNALGQRVKSWQQNNLLPGRQRIPIQSSGLKPGIYFVTLVADGFARTARCIVSE